MDSLVQLGTLRIRLRRAILNYPLVPYRTKMAVEKLLKFSLRFNKLRTSSLPVLSDSKNSVVNWVYWIFGCGGNHPLLNGNYGGTKMCSMQDEISCQAEDHSNILSDNILWMAAPKKRTSRKTKWLRHQRKFIKNREDIETCSVCGNAKLINHLCATCFERTQQATEEVLKDTHSHPSFWRPSVPENLKQFYKK